MQVLSSYLIICIFGATTQHWLENRYMAFSVYEQFQAAKKTKKLALLIDPDSLRLSHLRELIRQFEQLRPDFIMVGGSLIFDDQLDQCLDTLRAAVDCPLIIFPGSVLQISPKADALLFLSLISGRNPEYLIGQHVVAAPYLRKSGLETISTGYMLVDGGQATTASYMSHAMPIPADKPEIAVSTAMAGEMLGMSTLYLDAGSGARNAVPLEMTQAVAAEVRVPLIVGGGIRSAKLADAQLRAGADILMVGTGVEKDPGLLRELVDVVRFFNK